MSTASEPTSVASVMPDCDCPTCRKYKDKLMHELNEMRDKFDEPPIRVRVNGEEVDPSVVREWLGANGCGPELAAGIVDRVTEQPPPTPSPSGERGSWGFTIQAAIDQHRSSSVQSPAFARLIADMHQRNIGGIAKYGVPLQPTNGRNSLVDLYQELLDASVYATNEMRKIADESSSAFVALFKMRYDLINMMLTILELMSISGEAV